MSQPTKPGLTSQALLDKIDKLRELNAPNLDLPQLVVVGDQSSGKSSVLESLTGFHFPQAPGLCTRYATQITCIRDSKSGVVVKIIPCSDADTPTANRLRTFERTMSSITNEALEHIMTEANTAMGIRIQAKDEDPSLQAFSKHILKIEISGPEQEHFTVIDVPGIFRVPSPPFTKDSDVVLVRDIVVSYMQNSRTIVLAVLPANMDISTQKVLRLASDADPEGVRTIGVLTKSDLVTENASRELVKDLVLGTRNRLRLGYYIIKNRSSDDSESDSYDRAAQERNFFAEAPWKSLASSGRCGVAELKTRLSDLLMTISKKELPNVKLDASKRLKECQKELDALGPARVDQNGQRVYLGKLATRFQNVAHCALNGYYDGESTFTDDSNMKLITVVTKLHERFANELWKKGHKRQTTAAPDNENDTAYHAHELGDLAQKFRGMAMGYPELRDIISHESFQCPKPWKVTDDPIAEHILRVYQDNRGPELGTVGLYTCIA